MQPRLIAWLSLGCALVLEFPSAARAAGVPTAQPVLVGSAATAGWTESTKQAATTPADLGVGK